MFKQITAPDNVYAMQFSEKLTAADVRQSRQLLESRLKGSQQLGMVLDFTGLGDVSADAVAPGVKADLDFVRHVGRFHRLAMVSDKEWPVSMLALIDSFFTGIEARAFRSDQREDALQWAAEGPNLAPVRQQDGPSLRPLPTSKDDVYAFEIDGPITTEAVSGLVGEMQQFLDRHDKVRMLCRIRDMGGINPSLLTSSGLFSMKLAALKKVERYAVIGAPGWMKLVLAALGSVTSGLTLRAFGAENEADAWHWIGAEPAGAA